MTTAKSYPKTTDDFTYHITKDDDFWAFLFNDNPEDKKRRTLLRRIVSVFHSFGDSMTIRDFFREYSTKYHIRCDAAMLNQIFCTNETYPVNIFCTAWALFEAYRGMITFVPPSDSYVQLDDINAREDFFEKEKVKLESQASEIALHGDRLYRLLGKEGRTMKVTELIEASQKETHKKGHPVNSPDPRVFIGNLQIYFKDFFQLEIDKSFENFDIKRVEGPWPSTNLKHIESIVFSPPTYPPVFDLVTPIINGVKKERIFYVTLMSTITPSDGIFVNFSFNHSLEQRDYIKEELRNLFQFGKLRSISTVQKGWPCIYDSGADLYRCRITGRSTAANKAPLAMVECVDSGLITFSQINQLFDVPQYLMGVPPSGAYIVLTDRDGFIWPMSHPSEKKNWEIAFRKSCSTGAKVQAYMQGKATKNHYSGRRKFEVFKAQLKIDTPCPNTFIVPDIWRKEEKVYIPKF